MKPYVETIDYGRVPIRRRYTAGIEQTVIDIADNGTNEHYASIRLDYRTNQPFAVLLDEDMNEI